MPTKLAEADLCLSIGESVERFTDSPPAMGMLPPGYLSSRPAHSKEVMIDLAGFYCQLRHARLKFRVTYPTIVVFYASLDKDIMPMPFVIASSD